MSRAGHVTIWQFLARRVGLAIVLIMLVLIFNFLIIHSAPGDPISRLVGEYASPQYYEEIRRQYGLDRPLGEQLIRYMANVAIGDLGSSYTHQRQVASVILDRFPATLLLTGTSIALASLLGVLFGILASLRPRSLLDNMMTATTVVGYSIPIFWLAQLLLLTFSLRLRWFPVQGMFSIREAPGLLDHLLDLAHHLVLPAISLTVFYLALITRLTRAKMIETLQADYIRTARAKGLPAIPLVLRHALPNAILPIITVIGYNFSLIFAGSVLTESVFAWPGMGLLIFDAVYARDYPLLLGSFVFIAASVVFFNLLTDLLYGLIDPRLRYE